MNPFRSLPFKRLAVLGASFVLLSGAQGVAGETLHASQTFAFERSPNTADDGSSLGAQKALEISGTATTRLDYKLKRENGDQVRMAQWVEMELFPEHEELDRFRAETRASYWAHFSKDTQLRFEASHSYVHDREQMVFFRPRLGAQIRHRHDPQNLSRARLRFGYRDQNEATFQGFDQAEVRFELGHDWRAEDKKLRMSATAFAEHRAADVERFSYVDGGVRLSGRYPIMDDLMLSGSLEGSYRSYADDFSATIPERRRDLRVRGSLKLSYELSENVALTGSAGWDQAASNVDLRSFGGLTFGLGLEVSGLLWSDQ